MDNYLLIMYQVQFGGILPQTSTEMLEWVADLFDLLCDVKARIDNLLWIIDKNGLFKVEPL